MNYIVQRTGNAGLYIHEWKINPTHSGMNEANFSHPMFKHRFKQQLKYLVNIFFLIVYYNVQHKCL